MNVVGPFLVVAIVLVVSGATKVASPHTAAGLLSSVVGRPVPTVAGRALGLGEIALGAAALAGPRWAAVTLGVAYLGFAGVAETARRRGIPSCGCFGASVAPPGLTHVVLDLASAGVAFVVASQSVDRSLAAALDHTAVVAGATLVGLAGAVTMIIAAETVGAEVLAARRALALVTTERGHRR